MHLLRCITNQLRLHLDSVSFNCALNCLQNVSSMLSSSQSSCHCSTSFKSTSALVQPARQHLVSTTNPTAARRTVFPYLLSQIQGTHHPLPVEPPPSFRFQACWRLPCWLLSCFPCCCRGGGQSEGGVYSCKKNNGAITMDFAECCACCGLCLVVRK